MELLGRILEDQLCDKLFKCFCYSLVLIFIYSPPTLVADAIKYCLFNPALFLNAIN